MIFGGGGSGAPFAELVVQLAALIALSCWFLSPGAIGGSSRPDVLALACIFLFVMIPLVQLIPLPPGLWHSLPGRDVEFQALALVGQDQSWRPISVAPFRTFASALSLVPPLAMLFMTSHLPRSDRRRLIGVLAVLAILSGFVGVVQIVSGGAHWAYLYDYTHPGFATGFQANRNATADLYQIGIVAIAAAAAYRRDKGRHAPFPGILIYGVMLFLLMMTVLTGSRMGIAILPVTLSIAIAIYLPKGRISGKRWMFLAPVAGVVAVILYIASENAVLGQTWQRFDGFKDERFNLWSDTLFAIGQFWPVGSGLGTFLPTFFAAEHLESVNNSAPIRAHSDFLEFALEAGLPGAAVLGVLLGAISIRLTKIFFNENHVAERNPASLSLAAILVFGLHSAVDYPMRSMSLSVIAGLAIGLISFRSFNSDFAKQSKTSAKIC